MDQSKICHLLLIEDDEIDRLLVRTLINARAPGRFELVEAADLGRGLELLRERSFDLVLLDHTMPQLKSIQELRLVLAQRASRAVIMHTGYIAPETESQALAMGVRQVVEKGDLDPLWSAIERALNHEGEPLSGPSAEAVDGKTILVVEDEPAVRRVRHDRRLSVGRTRLFQEVVRGSSRHGHYEPRPPSAELLDPSRVP